MRASTPFILGGLAVALGACAQETEQLERVLNHHQKTVMRYEDLHANLAQRQEELRQVRRMQAEVKFADTAVHVAERLVGGGALTLASVSFRRVRLDAATWTAKGEFFEPKPCLPAPTPPPPALPESTAFSFSKGRALRTQIDDAQRKIAALGPVLADAGVLSLAEETRCVSGALSRDQALAFDRATLARALDVIAAEGPPFLVGELEADPKTVVFRGAVPADQAVALRKRLESTLAVIDWDPPKRITLGPR